MVDYTPSFLNLISRPKGTYLFILLILFFSRPLCSILFVDLYNTRSQHHPHLWNSSFPLNVFNLALPTQQDISLDSFSDVSTKEKGSHCSSRQPHLQPDICVVSEFTYNCVISSCLVGQYPSQQQAGLIREVSPSVIQTTRMTPSFRSTHHPVTVTVRTAPVTTLSSSAFACRHRSKRGDDEEKCNYYCSASNFMFSEMSHTLWGHNQKSQDFIDIGDNFTVLKMTNLFSVTESKAI